MGIMYADAMNVNAPSRYGRRSTDFSNRWRPWPDVQSTESVRDVNSRWEINVNEGVTEDQSGKSEVEFLALDESSKV